jgi:hypothetical protein
MASAQTAFSRSAHPHIHVADERCPYCDQPIPNEKAAEIRARMEADQRKQTEALTIRLKEQFALEKTQAQTAAREEGKKLAETAAQQKLEALTRQNVALQTTTQQQLAQAAHDKSQLLAQVNDLKANRDEEINKRVAEVREAMEKDKAAVVSKQAAKNFEEKQKLTSMVQDLQRRLEKQTADQLGEGAEIDLFDALTEEFPHDRIERIGKGAPGADIRHVVMHNGKEAGIIIYDSKNRNAWRNDYVEKLASDQKAARAHHAILAALKFPANAHQLHIQDGVIVANPARVVALAVMLRQHVIHVHTLRLGGADRAKKTAKLYEFITSKRCIQLLGSIDVTAEDLLDLQEKEKRAHDANWKRQGILLRSIQKSRADLCNEIDQIIESD